MRCQVFLIKHTVFLPSSTGDRFSKRCSRCSNRNIDSCCPTGGVMLDDNECTTSYLRSNTIVTATFVTNKQLGLRCMMLCSQGAATQYIGDTFFGVPDGNLTDLLQLFCTSTHRSEFLCSQIIYSTQPETMCRSSTFRCFFPCFDIL